MENTGNIHLSPVRKFLASRCGRPVDEVTAEVHRFADPRSHNGWQLRRYIRNMICRTAEERGDGVWDKQRNMKLTSDSLQRFYVNDSGLLCAVKDKPREKSIPAPQMEQVHLENGDAS